MGQRLVGVPSTGRAHLVCLTIVYTIPYIIVKGFWLDIMEFITTSQAAEKLGISQRRVQALITSGRLPAQKIGRDWLIRESDLEVVRERKTGYPKGRPRKPTKD